VGGKEEWRGVEGILKESEVVNWGWDSIGALCTMERELQCWKLGG